MQSWFTDDELLQFTYLFIYFPQEKAHISGMESNKNTKRKNCKGNSNNKEGMIMQHLYILQFATNPLAISPLDHDYFRTFPEHNYFINFPWMNISFF